MTIREKQREVEALQKAFDFEVDNLARMSKRLESLTSVSAEEVRVAINNMTGAYEVLRESQKELFWMSPDSK